MAVSLKLGRLGIELVLDADDFKSGMKGVLKSMKTLSKVGAVVGAGMAAGIGFAIKSFADLEQAVTNAAAVTGGDFKRNFELFKAAAMDAAAGTLFSAKESGQALEYLARAGLNAGQAVAALKPVLQFATAGNMDLAAATDIATDIMTAFRLKVEQLPALLDQLTYTSATSNTNIRMLGEAMKYVAPVAASMGQATSDVNAILGKLASAGIKSSQAGTSLRMMMVRMVRPMKTTKAAMQQLGTSMFDASGNFRSMIDVIGDLEKAQKTLSKQDFSAALARMFGSEALPAVNALLADGSKKLRTYSEDIAKATGKTKEMADLMANTVHGQFKIFKGNVETLAAKIGSMFLPALKHVNGWLIATVTNMMRSKAGFESTRDGIVGLIRVAAKLVRMFGFIGSTVSTVAGIFAEFANGVGITTNYIMIAIEAFKTFSKMKKGDLAKSDLQEFNRNVADYRKSIAQGMGNAGSYYKTAKEVGEVWSSGAKKLADGLDVAADKTEKLKFKAFKITDALNMLGLAGPKKPKGPGGPKNDGKAATGKSSGEWMGFFAEMGASFGHNIAVGTQQGIKNSASIVQEYTKKQGDDTFKEVLKASAEANKFNRQWSNWFEDYMKSVGSSVVDGLRTAGDALGVTGHAMGRAAFDLAGQLQSAQDPLTAATMAGKAWAQGLIGMVAEHEKTQQHLRVLKTAVSDLGIPDVLGEWLGAMEPAIGAIVAVTRALKPIGDMVDSGPLKEFLAGGFLKGVKVFVGVVLGLAEGVQMVSHTIANVAYKIVQGMYILVGGINKVINNIGLSIDIKPLQEATRRAKENVDRIASVGSAIDKAQEALADATIASGQAIYDEVKNRDKLNETLKESIRNAPAGFKVSLARYRATNRAGMGMLEGTGMRQQAVTINGNVYVDGGNKDGETLWKEMARMNFLKSGSQQATYTQVVAAKTRSFAQWG